MQVIQTCKDCAERTVGCHSKCERYLKAKARQHLINELRHRREQKYPDHITFTKELHHNKIEKVIKRH